MSSAAATPSPFLSDLRRGLDLELPGRALTRVELRGLVTQIAQQPALWQRHVLHDSERRHYVQLHRDLHVDVWMLCWSNQQETGFHDHDVSSGAVFVVKGDLVEDRFELEDGVLRERSEPRPAGGCFDFDAAHIHRVRHPADHQPAVSIHAYSPPLWRMGYYEAGSSLRRTSVTYAEELRERGTAVLELRQQERRTAEARAESLGALGELVGLLGYPEEWAIELERRAYARGRVWKRA